MQKIAAIGLATAALAATALPALADDQSIYFATGMIGGAPAYQQTQATWQTWQPYGYARRTAPYGDYALYGDDMQSGGYSQRSCTYSGGPKGTIGWTCP